MEKKVLVADDDKIIRYTAETFLTARGYKVITVEDGESAILTAKKERPDFAILDIEMPGKNGFEVCKEIKECPEIKNTVVIIISGNTIDIERGFDYGADDCLVKPISWNELTRRMKSLSK